MSAVSGELELEPTPPAVDDRTCDGRAMAGHDCELPWWHNGNHQALDLETNEVVSWPVRAFTRKAVTR